MTPEEMAEILDDVSDGDELRVTDVDGLTVDVEVKNIASHTDPNRRTERIYYETYFGMDIDESPGHQDAGDINVTGEGSDWDSASISYNDGAAGITRGIAELEVLE